MTDFTVVSAPAAPASGSLTNAVHTLIGQINVTVGGTDYTAYAENLTYDVNTSGGFGACSFRLRPPATPPSYDDAILITAYGETLYSGTVVNTPDIAYTGENVAYEVVGEGPARGFGTAEDFAWMGNDRDLGAWKQLDCQHWDAAANGFEITQAVDAGLRFQSSDVDALATDQSSIDGAYKYQGLAGDYIGNSPPVSAANKNWMVTASDSDGSVLLAGAYGGRLYLSVDGGTTWTRQTPAGNADRLWRTCASDSDGSVLLAGVNRGRLYLTSNSGADWAEVRPAGSANKGWQVCACDSDGSVLLAGDFGSETGAGGRLYISTDGGVNWTEARPAGDTNQHWRSGSASADGAVLLAGVHDGRLWLSTNSGTTWTQQTPAGVTDQDWRGCAVSANGAVLLAGDYGGSVPASGARLWLSTNGGSSWAETRPAGDVSKHWRSCAVDADGSVLLAGTYGGRLYRSTNSGSSWTEMTPAGSVDRNWRSCTSDSDGSVLMVAAYGGRLYLSTDGGATWHELAPADADYAADCPPAKILWSAHYYHIQDGLTADRITGLKAQARYDLRTPIEDAKTIDNLNDPQGAADPDYGHRFSTYSTLNMWTEFYHLDAPPGSMWAAVYACDDPRDLPIKDPVAMLDDPHRLHLFEPRSHTDPVVYAVDDEGFIEYDEMGHAVIATPAEEEAIDLTCDNKFLVFYSSYVVIQLPVPFNALYDAGLDHLVWSEWYALNTLYTESGQFCELRDVEILANGYPGGNDLAWAIGAVVGGGDISPVTLTGKPTLKIEPYTTKLAGIEQLVGMSPDPLYWGWDPDFFCTTDRGSVSFDADIPGVTVAAAIKNDGVIDTATVIYSDSTGELDDRRVLAAWVPYSLTFDMNGDGVTSPAEMSGLIDASRIACDADCAAEIAQSLIDQRGGHGPQWEGTITLLGYARAGATPVGSSVNCGDVSGGIVTSLSADVDGDSVTLSLGGTGFEDRFASSPGQPNSAVPANSSAAKGPPMRYMLQRGD